MKKNKKTMALSLATMLAVVLMLCGCGQKGGGEKRPDYLAVKMSEGDNWSIIDKDGKVVVEEEYPADASISPIYDGVFWVRQDDKYQLFSIDNPKKPVIDEEFTSATEFHAGRAAVGSTNLPIRIINTKGATVATLPSDIKYCFVFSDEGYASFKDFDNKYGILNTSGKIVVKAEYADMGSISDGVVLAKKNADDKKFLIIDTKGKKLGEINTEKYEMKTFTCREGKFLVSPKDAKTPSIIALDQTGKKLFDIKKAIDLWNHYRDGYVAFRSSNGKCGVADDKGDIVIRPKYEGLKDIGNGEFYAMKGGKMGVINAKDETIVDFDYEDEGYLMSANYVLHDASGYSLVNKEGKEQAAFDSYNVGGSSYCAEYVNIDAIVGALVRYIEDFESAKTAKQELENSGLDIDRFHYDTSVQKNLNIQDGKLEAKFDLRFDDYVAEEKFHEEKVNDGWFTTTNRVSDGWKWTNALPTSLEGDITIFNTGITPQEFCDIVLAKLAAGREKVGDNEFMKRVKSGGKKLEVYTRLTEDLYLSITYRQYGKAASDTIPIPADSVIAAN